MNLLKKLLLLLTFPIITSCGGGAVPKDLSVPITVTDHLYPKKENLLTKKELGLIRRIYYYKNEKVFTAIGYEKTCSFNESGKILLCGTKLKLPPLIVESDVDITVKADFNGDGKKESLTSYKNGFILKSDSGSQLGIFIPPADYWYKAAVSSSTPHVALVSTDENLYVLNSRLEKIIILNTPGVKAPLHITDGAFIELRGEKCFVSLFEGRGGWDSSILFIHNMAGKILYHEVLTRYACILALEQNDKGINFLLGGYGHIMAYSF